MTEPIVEDNGKLLSDFEKLRIRVDLMRLLNFEEATGTNLRELIKTFINTELAPLPDNLEDL